MVEVIVTRTRLGQLQLVLTIITTIDGAAAKMKVRVKLQTRDKYITHGGTTDKDW